MSAPGPSPRSPRVVGRALTRIARGGRPRDVEAAKALAREFAAGPQDVRSILAIKPHDQLGDFLVATPAIRALRARFPQATLTLVTRAYLEPLARRIGVIDRVLVVPRANDAAGAVRALAFPAAVGATRPDFAIVLNSVSRSRTADAIAALSGARLVVGRSGVGAGPLLADAPEHPFDAATYEDVYDLDLPIARSSAHQVDRVGDLVAWTGVASNGLWRLDLSGEEHVFGRNLLTTITPRHKPAGIGIGIHPAAANPLKCWPAESFVEWGTRMVAVVPNARLVVIDTPKDPGPARAVHAGLRARGIEAALLEARPLGELLGFIAALGLLACNDSGMMHVASALGVATLSFHSLGAPEEWAPRSETAIALHAEPIAAISVDEAVRAGETLLERIARGSKRAAREAAP